MPISLFFTAEGACRPSTPVEEHSSDRSAAVQRFAWRRKGQQARKVREVVVALPPRPRALQFSSRFDYAPQKLSVDVALRRQRHAAECGGGMSPLATIRYDEKRGENMARQAI